MRDSVIVPPGKHWQHIQQQAGVIAGFLTGVQAIDHQFTRWRGWAFDGDTMTQLTREFSGQWEDNTFRGLAGISSSPREWCVRLESNGDVGRPHFHYVPWVPDVYLTPSGGLTPLGITAWVGTIIGLETETLWASEVLGVSSFTRYTLLPYVTTNNHRRRAIPAGEAVI